MRCIASERAPNEMFLPLLEAALGPVPNGKGLDLGHYLTHALEPVPIVSDTPRVTSSSWLMYVVLRGVGSSPLTNSYQTPFHPHKPCKRFIVFRMKGANHAFLPLASLPVPKFYSQGQVYPWCLEVSRVLGLHSAAA